MIEYDIFTTYNMRNKGTPETPIVILKWNKGPRTFVSSGLATSVGLRKTEEGLYPSSSGLKLF